MGGLLKFAYYFLKYCIGLTFLKIIIKFTIGILNGEGGIAKNGMEYNIIYCFVIQVKDGKIKEIKEFCDTDLIQKAELGNY